MQIRLTVVDPQAPADRAAGRAASCDVLVTAPAGTALAAIASALASAVAGEGAPVSGQPVLWAGAERLDPQRCTVGEPPLIDGAVLSVGAPADPEPHPEVEDAPARLDVVAGPDAGGVHLLHGGAVRIGRSADADVPLDDPDVSRLHCAVTVAPDGRVSVADLDSTNGTVLDGRRVGARPVRFAPGALLRIGESAIRLAPAGGSGIPLRTTPDGEGYVKVGRPGGPPHDPAGPTGGTTAHGIPPAARPADGVSAPAPGGRPQPVVPGQGGAPPLERPAVPAAGPGGGSGALPGAGPVSRRRVSAQAAGGPRGVTARTGTGEEPTHAGRHGALGAPGPASLAAPAASPSPTGLPCDATRPAGAGTPSYGPGPAVPGPRPAEGALGTGTGAPGVCPPGGPGFPGAGAPGVSGPAPTRPGATDPGATDPGVSGPRPAGAPPGPVRPHGGLLAHPAATDEHAPADDTPAGARRRGGTQPQAPRRRGGLGAWMQRLTQPRTEPDPYEDDEPRGDDLDPAPASPAPRQPETWPDPAALLLTALGPGPRLWERGPAHPEALTVRLGTTDRAAPDGSGLLPAVPVTADLREVGSLGLAGPRPRLLGLARAVLAQLAALHSPDTLEIVLLSADRSRPLEERTGDWAWLGWLPHLRPGHGQDCRLLVAYDREQAVARTDELLRRLREAPPAPPSRRPSWAHDGTGDDPGAPGAHSVLVVDGDPGSADVREHVARLAAHGPRAGIHVICLAEAPAASPVSPVADTYAAACEASPAFRDCGAVALLSGDVATALRVLRIAHGPEGAGPVGHGTLAAVDAVSWAWAERFARALAPLRPEGAASRRARPAAPLPRTARLLDELGLARATPAGLMSRWADAADDGTALGGRAWAVLGAGERGPVTADLVAHGPHLFVEGPPGSGRTELLRAVVASLAAAERPDRLGLVLVDGRDAVTSPNSGEGLRVCTDVPHVTTHLAAHDPVRMREFAQALAAELKRRAELLGVTDFTAWHTGREVSGRLVAQRGPGDAGGDLDTPPSATVRLRPAARRPSPPAPPLPRLVVVVDDLDALVVPPLGSPGRPSAGSVVRALEAVAREGERLGVHLVAAAAPCARTAQTEAARRARLRIVLDEPGSGPDEPAPGRGRLLWPDGHATPFQGGRVTGRIPRTATLRPTVVPLDWHRMGDPPTRRPVKELGNGPTDLALLASALERAARQVEAAEVPSLL